MRKAAGTPLSVQEVMARARVHPGERVNAKRALRDLAREGVLRRDARRFTLPAGEAGGGAPAGAARPFPAAAGPGGRGAGRALCSAP